MREEHIWRRLLIRMFTTEPAFKRLCLLNDWWRLLPNPRQDTELDTERKCKEICYKIRNFDALWKTPSMETGKIYAGGLFSCVKLSGDSLFVGMLDGLIKMWNLSEAGAGRRPVRVFEGHEESVTCVDVADSVLVSGSLDHTVRVWSTETSSLLRVLRRQGSPIVMVRLLSDRLLWWTRSGSFQISSWNGFKRVEPDVKFSLMEDPVFCLMEVGEHYVVTTETQEAAGLSSRDIVVYSSRSGTRLFEKDIFAGRDISCLALHGHLLYIGCGRTVEVWDVNISTCLAILQAASTDLLNITVKKIAVSDFLLVASLSNGNMFYMPVINIIEQSLLTSSEPAIINWQVSAETITNTEQTWKNIDFSDKSIVFGLERKLGDIKIIRWDKSVGDSLAGAKVKQLEDSSAIFDIDLK